MAQVRYACDALCQGLLLEITEVALPGTAKFTSMTELRAPEIQRKMSSG